MMHSIGQPFKSDPTPASNFPGNRMPQLTPSDACLLPRILDRLQRRVGPHEGENIAKLPIVPMKVNGGVMLALCVSLRPASVDIKFLVRKLLEVLLLSEATLKLELKIPELLFVPIVVRDFLEGLTLAAPTA